MHKSSPNQLINLLPIIKVLPELLSSLEKSANVVLSADPGAGKTTRVPLALLDAPWLSGKKIVMLEPRRLAAQRAAGYMAQLLNERTGETVGYRIRGDNKIGKRTRIEVVTEAVLTRMLQSDATLPDVGLVIFDEFHERSIHTDLGLALALDVQEHLRPDLRILVMSATLNGVAISSLLGDAQIVKSEGRMYPVETIYLPQKQEGRIEQTVAAAIKKGLRDTEGDLLVFLPGQREIRNVERLLTEGELPDGVVLHTLFGDASPDRQRAALEPDQNGKRKIILSTSIAETSLTIDGVRVVIDSGLARVPSFDPRRGMTGLITVPASQATTDQRRGRAGRQQAGVCYRLWTEPEQHHLPQFSQPEILTADLAPFLLEVARWGSPDGKGLRFIDEPPAPHISQAKNLLMYLGALDKNGKLTSHGRAMNDLPIHPRFAHMLIKGKELGVGVLACDIAALLEERDLFRSGRGDDIDLHSRLYVLKKGGNVDRGARDRIRTQSDRLRNLIGVKEAPTSDDRAGVLVALAYPERVGKQREKEGLKYQLSGGSGAVLPKGSLLSREEYLAVAEVDGAGSEVKIFLAEPVSEKEIKEAFGDQLTTSDEIRWDNREEAVVAKRVVRFGTIELSHVKTSPPEEKIVAAMIEGVRLLGLQSLPWTKDAESVRSRSEWLRSQRLVNDDWPDLSDEHLLSTMEEWLAPFLSAISRRSHLSRLDMSNILRSRFSFDQLKRLDSLAPTHLTVPTGSHIPLDYASGTQPVLAVRLQEMFGQTETPAVGGGKVKVLLHLLSPAHRPLAVTQDLPSFWKNAYPDVRKDMRGRYPKHYWPDNPLEAEPTRRVKRK